MKWLCVAILFASLPARAQSLLPWWAESEARPSSVILAKYTASGCGGAFTGTGAVTTARASTESGQCSNGTWVAALANALVVTDKGAQIFGANSNTLAQSSAVVSAGALNTPWAGSVLGTLVADSAIAPDGTQTADTVSLTAAAASAFYQRSTGLTQSTTYTCSGWVWTDSGTKSFRLGRTNGASWVTATVSATVTATTTPQRFSLTYTTGAGETQSDCTFGGEQKTPFTPSAGLLYAWGLQHELGSLPGPYVPTGASPPVSRGATMVSVPSAIPADGWCVTVKATAPAGSVATSTLFTLGTVGSANSVYLHGAGFGVYGGDGVARGGVYSVPAGTNTHTVCALGGTLRLFRDSVDVTPAVPATGTGIMSAAPATAYIGNRSVASWELKGYVERFCQCKVSNPLACERECLR